MALYNLPEQEDPEHWIEQITEMIDSGDYNWAFDTLTGIGEDVEEKNRITQNQIRAITNIRNSKRDNY